MSSYVKTTAEPCTYFHAALVMREAVISYCNKWIKWHHIEELKKGKIPCVLNPPLLLSGRREVGVFTSCEIL